MRRMYIVGGVLAAAALAGGGAALDAAVTGPGTPVAMAAPSPTAAPGPVTAVMPTRIGTAALPPGTALVDGAGRTLYLFEADTGTTSTCTGACAQVWPPVLASSPTAAGVEGAARTALVSTAARADGTLQVTYHGHPLYYFAGDKKPGDATGQGIHNFGGGWYVVAPDGNKIDTDDDAAPAPAAPSGAGSGY